MHAPSLSRDVVIRQLVRLRLARNAFFASVIVGALISILGQLLQDRLQVVALLLMVPFVVCVLLAVAAVGYLLTHRCPRCAQPFFWASFKGNYFSSTCLNCGVKLDASNL